jgi:hypothetical protein
MCVVNRPYSASTLFVPLLLFGKQIVGFLVPFYEVVALGTPFDFEEMRNP